MKYRFQKNYYCWFSLKMSMFGTLHHSLEVTRSKSDLSMSNKGGRPLNNINTLKVVLSGATL